MPTRTERDAIRRAEAIACAAVALLAACGAPAPEGARSADAATSSDAGRLLAPLLTATDAAHATALLRMCGVGALGSSADQLLYNTARGLDTIGAQAVRCAAFASSCDAFTRCMTGPHGATGAPNGGRCDGDFVVASLQGIPVALDCRVWAGGGTCGMGPIGARCEPRGGCGDAGSASRCDGTVAVDCTDGDFAALDCAELEPGATCQMVNGAASCVAGGRPSCIPGALGRCEGDTFVQCAPRSPAGSPLAQRVSDTGTWFEYRADCPSVGMRCGATGCISPLSACTGLASGVCNGSHLQQCVLGQIQDLACAAVGGTSCTRDSCTR